MDGFYFNQLYSDSYWSAFFLLLGFLCLFLEIFIPSGGILGLLSMACTGFAVFGFFYQGKSFIAMVSLAGFLVYTIAILYLVLRRVTFKAALSPQTSTSVDERTEGLLGKEGVALTPLRPAGVALIQGKRVDVVTIGDFVEKDIPVRVVEISGNRVVVRHIEGRSKG
ncbi:MAG: hypothetical protein HY717_17290 [Planctomycetes bacterium]|nr:hypothetical protein [Planctomycetota bacterium]